MSVDDFRRGLFDAGLLVDGGTAGIYHRSFKFEKIIRNLEAHLSAEGHDERLRQLYFPPVQALSALVGADYLTSFPDLIGAISSFRGSEAELPAFLASVKSGGDWAALLSLDEVALCSAACHSVYPLLAGTTLPAEGILYEVQSYCFRHEPSLDPARMQSFRQHEFVYVGSEAGALEHRDQWLVRGRDLLEGLGLSVEVVVANDPFFGRAGRLLSAGQREKELKFELISSISSEVPGAISSANCHEDHFGSAYSLSMPDGKVAHSACIGFGLERITLALLLKHGFEIDRWPSDVRDRLSSVDSRNGG